jgi:ADP-heptose:LPS heptosyltransferase
MMDAATAEHILVIKHGALGDVVLALGPMQAIRAHHPQARITLLTTAPFVEFLRASRLFDEIWIDERQKRWNLLATWSLMRKLRSRPFARVYDLQTSDRSSFYYRLFRSPKPEWSGIAPGASHPHDNPQRDRLHTVVRQAEQLRRIGIEQVPLPDLDFANADISRFGLARSFALLFPGGAAHRPAKRWPIDSYAVLAKELTRSGLTPVLLGGEPERELTQRIHRSCAEARDLAGQTSLFDIVALARAARVAIGNDTGPMHLIAAAGCPSIVLFSHDSDPALCAPVGPVSILRKESLTSLSVGEVSTQAIRLRR